MKFGIENEIDEILNRDYSAQETVIFSNVQVDDTLTDTLYAEGDAAGGAPAQAPAGNAPAAGAANTNSSTTTKTETKVNINAPGGDDMGDLGDMGDMGDLGGMGGMGGFGGGNQSGQDNFGAPETDVDPLPGEDSEDIQKKLVVFRQYRRLKDNLKSMSDIIDDANKRIQSLESRNILSRMDSEITTTLEQIDFILAEDFRKKEIKDSENEYKSMEEKAKLIAKTIERVVNHAAHKEVKK
jgi:hypothetical protein